MLKSYALGGRHRLLVTLASALAIFCLTSVFTADPVAAGQNRWNNGWGNGWGGNGWGGNGWGHRHRHHNKGSFYGSFNYNSGYYYYPQPYYYQPPPVYYQPPPPVYYYPPPPPVYYGPQTNFSLTIPFRID
jgi:hypothetical protein